VELLARIVVGVDGTEWGLEALRQALTLAPENGSTVEAVTALDTAPAVWTGFEASYWVGLLDKEAQEARDEAADTLSGRAGSARVVEGRPVPVLREARDSVDATLLALGGRHSSRLLGIVLGDTVTELLHDGVCSVFVARPPENGTWQPRTIVVGVDGSPSSLAGLACADDIATRLGGRVEVVAAGEAAAIEGDGEWAERLERQPDAEPVGTLLERSREADLVVVGSRSLHGLRALGSVSERVVHGSSCSVLVVHAPEVP
jgi:nucleotide-binding universal stress UspA family protein